MEKKHTSESKLVIPESGTSGMENPEQYGIRMMVGKNVWLTRIRWIYNVFILSFSIVYNALSEEILISYRTLLLISILGVIGNIIFSLTLKRGLKFPSEQFDFKLFSSLAGIQLDFDLVILSLVVFYSGGFDSPVLVLFIFYIMVAPFLVPPRKAYRCTILAIIFVLVIFFSHEGEIISMKRLTMLIAFNIILLFTHLISAYLSKNLAEKEQELRALLQKTKELSVTDGLTNLYNQTHFFLLLKLQLEKSRRYSTPFSLIMFDVDYFKNYNDNHGHIKGSAALRQIGELMRKVSRSADMLAKYGGDEFAVILPNSDKVGAFLAADRLREIVEEEPIIGRESQPSGKLTLSLGISSYPEHGQTVEEILDRADQALFFAKKTGRNKTIIYNEDLGDT